MKVRTLVLAVTALAATSAAFPAFAGEETSIPLVSHQGIQNFRADGNEALYVEGRGKQWYRVELMGQCSGLNFATGIGVEGGATDRFDRFSTLVVDGNKCAVKSVTESEDPTKAAQ